MIPAGFPGVIRDGGDALRWAAGTLEIALSRVSEWVAHEAPATDKFIADAMEAAKRRGDKMIVDSVPDAAELTRTFTDSRRDLLELADRLGGRSRDEWVSGGAAQYFSGIDLSLLQNWQHGGNATLFRWLGVTEDQMRLRKIQFVSIYEWLEKYLAMHA